MNRQFREKMQIAWIPGFTSNEEIQSKMPRYGFDLFFSLVFVLFGVLWASREFILENSQTLLLQIFLLPCSLVFLVFQSCVLAFLISSHSSWMFWYFLTHFPLWISILEVSIELSGNSLILSSLSSKWTYWWHSSFPLWCFVSCISFDSYSCHLSADTIWTCTLFFNKLIIVILNSLSNNSNICVISESGSDAYFIPSECVCFFLSFSMSCKFWLKAR